jgi:REP element-mobilizing transposase RayT
MAAYDPQRHHRRSIRLKGYDYTQPGAYFITLVTYQRDELFGKIVDGEIKLTALGQIVQDEWMRSISLRKEIGLNEDEFSIMPNHFHGIVWIVDRPDGLGKGVWHTPGSTQDAAIEEGSSLAPRPSMVRADGVRPIGEEGESLTPRLATPLHPGESLSPLHSGVCDTPISPAASDVSQPGVCDTPISPAASDVSQPGVCDTPLPPAASDVSQPGTSHTGTSHTGASLAPLPPAAHALHRAPKSLGSFIAGFKAAVTSRARRELGMECVWQRNYYEHIIRNEREFTNIWNYIDTNPLRWSEDQLRPTAPPNQKSRDK